MPPSPDIAATMCMVVSTHNCAAIPLRHANSYRASSRGICSRKRVVVITTNLTSSSVRSRLRYRRRIWLSWGRQVFHLVTVTADNARPIQLLGSSCVINSASEIRTRLRRAAPPEPLRAKSYPQICPQLNRRENIGFPRISTTSFSHPTVFYTGDTISDLRTRT